MVALNDRSQIVVHELTVTQGFHRLDCFMVAMNDRSQTVVHPT